MNAIAILHYKTDEMTTGLVNALGGDVYVVVNGCSYSGPGRKIWLRDNLYFSGGWNAAMKALSSYEYVWMLNSDVDGPTQEMFAILVSEFEVGVAAITPTFNSPHTTFSQSSKSVTWMDWCAPVVSSKAWLDVGPFDTRFTGYGADIDWCVRAREKGYTFRVSAQKIHHLGSMTAKQTGIWLQNDAVGMDSLLRKKYGKSWMELIS